jgi:hypothetical protein
MGGLQLFVAEFVRNRAFAQLPEVSRLRLQPNLELLRLEFRVNWQVCHSVTRPAMRVDCKGLHNGRNARNARTSTTCQVLARALQRRRLRSLRAGTEENEKMDKATVCKMRPFSWKIYVQGRNEADYVRGFLSGMRFDCSEPQQEPQLHDPPVFGIVVTPAAATPFTAEELQSLLLEDENIELSFEDRLSLAKRDT